MTTIRIEKMLGFCMRCKAVREKVYEIVNGMPGKPILRRWVRREKSPKRYDKLMEQYEGELSHGYCRPCSIKIEPRSGK